MSDKIIGIDLGTTNSAFAVVEGDDPKIIPNSEGGRTTPSVVARTDEDEWLVGAPAVNQEMQNPQNTVRSIKRKMGDENYTALLQGEEYTPEEISSIILRKIKGDAERYLGETVTSAVITVPAYFNDRQRQATKNAGEIAGLSVERIINEPTAAAMAYGLDQTKSQTVLIVDLGGGTFDVTLLDLSDGVYDVLATNGNNNLGGDDWDQALIDHAVEQFEWKHGVDLREKPRAYQKLTAACEELKRNLSARTEAQLNLPFLATQEGEPIGITTTISRDEFESMTADLRKQLADPIKDVLNSGGVPGDHLDNVLLIGGSTRMPQIETAVDGLVGPRPRSAVNPDEAVALGAAIQGSVLSGRKDDVLLLDVTPKSLGIEVKGGLFEPLIDRNTTIPTKESKKYTTAEDNQTSVYIKAYQGEKKIANKNELLGEFELTGIPPAEAGTPEVTVEFAIDASGIVSISATDLKSGHSESIRIEGGTGLSEGEVDEMKERIDNEYQSTPHPGGLVE